MRPLARSERIPGWLATTSSRRRSALTPSAGATKAEIASPVIVVMSASEIDPMPPAVPSRSRPSDVRYDGSSVNPRCMLLRMVSSAPRPRWRARNRSRASVYSAVCVTSDWIQRNGRLRRASGSLPKSLPSRLTPTLNRGSPAITWTAVAPPIEWPTIPTCFRSRCPAIGDLGSSCASRPSWSSTNLLSAARIAISRSSAGCGGGPITSGWIV